MSITVCSVCCPERKREPMVDRAVNALMHTHTRIYRKKKGKKGRKRNKGCSRHHVHRVHPSSSQCVCTRVTSYTIRAYLRAFFGGCTFSQLSDLLLCITFFFLFFFAFFRRVVAMVIGRRLLFLDGCVFFLGLVCEICLLRSSERLMDVL